MSRKKSPYLKKQDEYDQDRYALAEYPTWFRRHWPKKKARLRRKERHKVSAILQNAQWEELSAAALNAARPNFRARKWGAATVREIVEHKKQRRQ